MAAASSRERARTVGLALLGLLFFATASIPVVQSIVQPPRCTAGPMLNAVLATLGVFLLLAARNPSAHRSLILFAAWSSFAHAAIMLVMSFQVSAQRGVLLASVALVGLGGVLLGLRPAWERSVERRGPLEERIEENAVPARGAVEVRP